MVVLLRRLAVLAALAAAWPAASLAAPGGSDKHHLDVGFELGAAGISADLDPWLAGGLGKLRFSNDDTAFASSRLFVDYRGRIGPTLSVRAVADYWNDASGGVDLTEAYLQWRPVPDSPNQHRWRFGAFYPPLSLENSAAGWTSPYTISYSAINSWLGEEIRPIGAEWSLRRRVGRPASAHVLGAFAAGFYGNDPAATLLFWRGWSLHDRQTRLDDRLPIPPFPAFGTGSPEAQTVEPIAEIDSRPGYYAGIEWSYSQRLKVQLARYDNRARIDAFRNGQWGWHTRFSHLGLQAALPAQVGLIAQWMSGDTTWIAGARPDHSIFGPGPTVVDEFDASFVLVTKTWGQRHRLSARHDEFSIDRPGSTTLPVPDDGHALTVAYRYTGLERISIAAEWLEIDSARDLWSNWYAQVRERSERQFFVRFSYALSL